MKNTEILGRILMIGGGALLFSGVVFFLASKFGLPLGNLPGDIRIEGKQAGFYFPLTTCLIVSAVLTLLINLAIRIFKK
jgi:hypothetical protein